MVVFVVKRNAVREAKNWRYAVSRAEIGCYAVRKGWGVTLQHQTNIFERNTVGPIAVRHAIYKIRHIALV